MNLYDKTKTLRQNIGTSYEYFVLEQLKKDYDILIKNIKTIIFTFNSSTLFINNYKVNE
jgi:hypothetical protein